MPDKTDYINIYTDFLAKNCNLKKKLSIICDGSNGSTGNILQNLLPKLNLASFRLINDNPDPEFSAHGPNPMLLGVLDQLKKQVVSDKADFGIAFDADGDRSFFVDNKGNVVPSFVMAALLFRGTKPPYVADELVYQSLMAMKIFSENELKPSRVGQVFLRQTMKVVGAQVGAEFSCHFNYKDFFYADSGLFTLVRVLSILSSSDFSLSEFSSTLPPHSVTNDDLKIEGKDVKAITQKFSEFYKAKNAKIDTREGITAVFKDSWVNIRPSNTEPVLRFYAGGPTPEAAKALIEEAEKLV